MSTTELHSLDLLTLPVWIVSPHTKELVFVNTVARELMQAPCFPLLHEGIFSTHTQNDLTICFSGLRNRRDIVEILITCREGEDVTMASRLSIRSLPESDDTTLFEGVETSAS